ncbi:putative E3 ubiquitin-protein ligase FANCL [Cocos nucifera]|uniref:Putative E3 ubiquitin-protein ligase FANCL n=1 Tax=Cocos nucifera TaxID=13894 RepID=A0A8K0ITJ8_COCNU|nr:putative E3 ubiquitin-protein ligase FANCL [Cocos nucifera]
MWWMKPQAYDAGNFLATGGATFNTTMKDDKHGVCCSEDDQEGSGEETELPEIDPRAEDAELKRHLLKKYSGYLSSLRQELCKKKKKGVDLYNNHLDVSDLYAFWILTYIMNRLYATKYNRLFISFVLSLATLVIMLWIIIIRIQSPLLINFEMGDCRPYIGYGADVPYICEIEWSKSSKLKNIVQQFREHLQKLQEFWSIMEDIDRNLWVLDPKQPSLATSYRQICLDSIIDLLRKNWRKNGRKWTKDKPFHENLATLLETTLPRPHAVSNKNDEQVDCGICYARYLPLDDEFGDNSGSAPDYTCENLSCSRAFHTVCLRDWLRSITTTRQSFDVLFGNCPYCSEPVAVKVSKCS